MIKHGLRKHKLYSSWSTMRQRCSNPNNQKYSCYGARGIAVCAEWDNSFLSFYNWAMSNGYAPNLTLERKDVDGNYEPENCAWVTIREQSYNKRDTIWITHEGRTQSLRAWAREKKMSYPGLFTRYYRQKWPIEKLFTPIRKQKNNRNLKKGIDYE